MKNHYNFDRLKKIDLPDTVNQADMYFAMRKLRGEATGVITLNDLADIDDLLADELFIVATDLISQKGKKVEFRGSVALTNRPYFISFLKRAVAEGDQRPMLISPYFDSHPEEVSFITKDECHLY
jgi:hypothetical protein